MELPGWQQWGGLGIKMQFYEWGQSVRAVRMVLLGLSKQYPEVKVITGKQMPNAAGLCLAAISKQVKICYKRNSPCAGIDTKIFANRNKKVKIDCPNVTFRKHLVQISYLSQSHWLP